MSTATRSIDGRSSVGVKLTTTNATAVYTVPVGVSAVAWNMRIANVDATNAVDVTISWYDDDATGGAATYALISTYSLQPDSSQLFDLGGMGLGSEDELRVTASAANDLEVVTTYSEMTR